MEGNGRQYKVKFSLKTLLRERNVSDHILPLYIGFRITTEGSPKVFPHAETCFIELFNV